MLRAQPDVTADLVLVGGHAWDPASLFESAEEQRLARSRVILTGFVPDDDLAPIYTGARAFVFPSFFEGFGLPALELPQPSMLLNNPRAGSELSLDRVSTRMSRNS